MLIIGFIILFFTFLAGFVTHHVVYRYYQRTIYLPDKARRLLNTAIALRQKDVNDAMRNMDECVAAALYKTAYHVSDDKMSALPEQVLLLWQQTKDYYARYNVEGYKGASMVTLVKRKLEYVPWSKFQLAKKKFDEKYSNGKLEIAPQFSMTYWFGQCLAEKDTKGKVILLDFWNIYCTPCVKSLPTLQKMYDKYKENGLVVIACTGGYKDETAIFLKKNNYTFPAGVFSEQTWLNFAVEANPTYFLIDRGARLAWGPEHRLPTDEEITVLLEQGNK